MKAHTIAVIGAGKVGKTEWISSIPHARYDANKNQWKVRVKDSNDLIDLTIIESSSLDVKADRYIFLWDVSNPNTIKHVFSTYKAKEDVSTLVANKCSLALDDELDLYNCTATDAKDNYGVDTTMEYILENLGHAEIKYVRYSTVEDRINEIKNMIKSLEELVRIWKNILYREISIGVTPMN